MATGNFRAVKQRALDLGYTEYQSAAGWYSLEGLSLYGGYQYYLDVNAEHPAIVCDDDKRELVGIARWPLRVGK